LAAVLVLVGAVSGYRGHATVRTALWSISTGLFLLAALLPGVLRPVMRFWLGLGTVLSWVNTRIILSVLFYAVFAPVGWIRRLVRDPLDRKLHDGRDSYWIRRDVKPFDAKSYENQF
jgi:hypothetical protein